MSLLQQIHKQGYAHLKSFFDVSEIESLKAELELARAKGANPCLSESPVVQSLVFGSSMTSTLRKILGDKLVYSSDYTINAIDFWSQFNWHKDSVERFNDVSNDWDMDPYPIIRVGVYLGDYTRSSGSLGIQPESHRGSVYNNPGINVKSRPGDLVLWPITTTHTANSPSFFWNPDKSPTLFVNDRKMQAVHRRLVIALSKIRFLREPDLKKRQVLFFSVAKAGEELARYSSYLLHRKYFLDELRKRGNEKIQTPSGSCFLDLHQYIADIDGDLISDKYDSIASNSRALVLEEKIASEVAIMTS